MISHPNQSISLLKEEYAKTSEPKAKLNFARILAILGDQTGKDTLIEAVKKAPDWEMAGTTVISVKMPTPLGL